MPTVTVDDRTVEVPTGTRLTIAIEQAGIEIGHRCGGKARCTTCRVRFLEGEPDTMTRAEFAKLRDAGLLGDVRLSCQIALEGDATVEVLKTLQSEGWTDTGPAPDPEVVPEAAWFDRRQLEREAEAG
jgi:ferredoxin